MSKAVLELQRKCWDSNISCDLLLLNALSVAKALSIQNMVDFCNQELSGYVGIDSSIIPQYRKCTNAFQSRKRGAKEWHSESLSIESDLLNDYIRDPISEICVLASSSKDFYIKVPSVEEVRIAQQTLNLHETTDVRIVFPKYLFYSIAFRIRCIVAEWTNELVQKGILGEDLLFSTIEKEKAQNMPEINIIINGNVVNSNVAGLNSTLMNSLFFQEKP